MTSVSPTSPISLLSGFFTHKRTSLSTTLASIHHVVDSELEPEQPYGLTSESYSAVADPLADQKRYRSVSDLSIETNDSLSKTVSTTSSVPVGSPIVPQLKVAKWIWPESQAMRSHVLPVSRPINPES